MTTVDASPRTASTAGTDRSAAPPAPQEAPPGEASTPGAGSRGWPLMAARVGVLAAALGAWWAIAAFGRIDPVILPSPAAVASDLFDASRCVAATTCGVQGYFLWQHVLATLERILVGLGVGVATGITLGWLLASHPRARLLLEPYITFLRALPPLGYVGLLIVWFGVGDVSKVVLIFLGVFPVVTVSTILGVTAIPRSWLLAAQSLGASRAQQLRRVVIPGAAPEIIHGIRLASGVAWSCIVAAEMTDGIPGIGGLAYVSGAQLQTSMVIGSVIVIGVIALAIDVALARLQRRASTGKGH